MLPRVLTRGPSDKIPAAAVPFTLKNHRNFRFLPSTEATVQVASPESGTIIRKADEELIAVNHDGLSF
jgi:hypothetical protein